jgi:outer membrane protein TolC
MLRYVCLFLALLAPLSAAAEEKAPRPSVLKLTLESAIQAALSKSFAIQVQQFDPKIAKQDVTQALGHFDPSLYLNVNRNETAQRELFANDIRLETRAINRLDTFSAGLRGATSIGLTYDVGVASQNTLGIFNLFTDNYQSQGGITLTQPLLRGFGTAANLAQVRIARNNVQISEWALRKGIIDIITKTNFVYNELHYAHEALLVAERSRELARQLFNDNTSRFKIGTMAQLDVTEARAQVAAREEAVILAERVVRDNENALKQLVTNDMERMLSIAVEIAPPPVVAFHADVPAGIRDALQLRPDYRQNRLDIENRNITIALTRNTALPRFDLTGSLALLGFDSDFAGSFNRVGRRDETVWTIGAIVSIPIPNREGRGAIMAAKLEAAKSLVALQELEQQIVVDVDNASGQVITAHERIVSTREARRLAAETLDAGEARLHAGAGTTFEVLQFQNDLTQAESAVLRAEADYNNAIGEYYRQTATALRIHNVVLN